MQRHGRTTTYSSCTTSRRARTLAGALAALLVGTAMYVQNAQGAQACGTQADFLVKSDPVLAAVRPADCSRVFQTPPDFAWPATHGGNTYTVTLTSPDGSTLTRTTANNWLAWDTPLPAGTYTWTVTSAGRIEAASQPRSFTVDESAAAFAAAPAAHAPKRAPRGGSRAAGRNGKHAFIRSLATTH